MSTIQELMLEEARQSFFQLENMVSRLDSKAFGLVALDCLMFIIAGYVPNVNNIFTSAMSYWQVPLALFGWSLFFMLSCVWPRDWGRGGASKSIEKYSTFGSESATEQLAVDYSSWEGELSKVYTQKIKCIRVGLAFMVVGILSMVGLFIYPLIAHSLSGFGYDLLYILQ